MSTYAIVGLSCLFPGARTPNEFWDNLRSGTDSRREGGTEVFGSALTEPAADPAHRIRCTRGGFVSGFRFDPSGYRLDPAHLSRLDRLFHWTLHTGREALRDSGHADRPEVLARTALVLGNYSFPTPSSAALSLPLVHENVVQGLTDAGVTGLRHGGAAPPPPAEPATADNARVSGAPAAVTAAALGLGGPRYALDAACSSTLYALKLACDHLESGEADLALAGGVSAPDPTLIHLSFSDLHAYPEDGFSQPFDTASGGILTGQGAGMLAVRRLPDALAAGERIYAVIDGIGLSNDGTGRHLLVPHAAGQHRAYELAYEDAGLSPSRVDYLECHATGTPVGDRTESETVTAFFGDRGRVPLLGSVKGNIGHLLTVAGLSSLIKVVLAAHHGHIPPTIGVTRPQAALPEGALVREGRSWPVGDGDGDGTGPRHAAVSAFGFGGTNAHVVLSVPQGTPQPAAAAPGPETAPGTEPNPASDTGPNPASDTDPDPTPHLDITGIGAHFGPLTTAWDVERAQFEGTDVLGPLPARRWRGLETTPDGTLAAAGLTPGSLPPGAFVASVDVDPVDQRIPPSDLGEYNLQHALISEVAEEALRDAGYSRAPAEGEQAPAARRIGVVIAMEIEPSAHLHLARYGLGSFLREVAAATGLDLSEDELAGLAAAAREGVHRPIVANEVLSYIGNIMTSRISSLWNFTGPSFTLSAGEAGTAEALRVARSLLREPATEAVLVGAVDLAASPESLLLRTARGDGPASGPGLSFGEGSRGWRIGEGAGAVVLTRADDPDRPRPTAYGRLEAVEIGYAAPVDGAPAGADPALLAETARRALRVAGAEPADIGYLEAHADGDDATDRAELDALAEVYPRGAAEVALGSAGAQFGRTGAAAGMAGLLRAVLSAHHGYLPGTPTWTRPAADLADAFDRSALYVPDSSRPWLRRTSEGRRRAAVSFLGAGGVHGHLVLSSGQHPAPRPSDWQRAGGPLLLPLGAEDLPGLLTALEAARAELAGTTGVDPWETARRAAADLPADAALRCVLVGRNGSQLLAQLDRALADLPAAHAAGGEWSTPAGSYFTASPIGPDGKVALVYPGAVNTYPGLGRDLFRAFPALRDTFERETADPDRAFRTAELYPRGTTAPTRRELMRHEAALSEDLPFMLATGTTFAILHTDLVREILGVPAHGAFGYSLGESSMLFATGGWHRSARRDDRISATPLFRDRLCGPRRTVREAWGIPEETADSEVWACHVLLGDADRVRAALTGYDKVFLTHVNTPTETVVAGDPDQCRQLIAALGCQAARSPVNAVMHCPPVDAEVDGLAELNDHRTGDPGGLELLSAYDYGPIADLERGAVARRIARTLRSTIDFPRLVDAAHQRGYRYFIEVGPSATCTRWVRETLGDRPHLAVSVDRRGADTVRPLAELVARLVAHGLPVRLSALLAPAGPSARPTRRRFAVGGGAPVAAAVTEAVRPVLAARSAVTARHPAVAATRSAAPLAPVAPSVPVLSEENAPMPTDPTLSEPEVMTFDGDPVAVLPWAAPESSPEPSPEPSPDAATPGTAVAPVLAAATAAAPPVPRAALPVSPTSPGYAAADLVRELRRQMVDTHQVVMETQQVLQQAALGQVLDTLGAPAPAPSAPAPALPAAPSPPLADRSAAAAVPAPRDVPRTADAAPGGRRDTAGAPDTVGPPDTAGGPVWNEQDLLAFATGSVADVFGAAFAPVDGYGKRVRLPAPPYHFVTRVTAIDAVTGEFKPSTITTEYDVPEDAWYAVDGGVPPAVAIEAGQCDLLLISYLGIDFHNQGRRVYRLLDSTLVFHGDLPTTGQTLRYDISIDRFVHQGEVTLFFFSYLCYADGELILELKDACAGFFSEEELESPLGVVETARDRAEREALTRTWFKPLARTTRDHLTSADLDLLAQGRPGDVFGPDHGQDPGINPALRLPDARLRMADEITVDRTGGPRGLGALTAVKRLEPDAWYFTCHFPDDPVLAGSLVAEGAVQILQTYLLHQGMHLVLPDARFQTVVGLETSVQVRGQITPRDREIRYEVEVRELTLLPRPTVVADVRVHLGDKPVIRMRNFGIQIREKDGTPYRPEKGGVPAFLGRRNRAGEPAMINELHLAHAAKGDLGTAMGPEFDIYAASRAPYIPNGDFQFVDRIMSLTGVRGDFSGTPEMVTEYDSPPDAWYYTHNAHPHMPNCVYMETSLQAAILLGYYLGATLDTPGTEYAIRNLDGTATLVKDLDLRGRTVRHHSTLLMTSAISGAVLQKFSYELSADGEVFYRGESLFGYFSESALANQVGLDGGRRVPSWLESEAPDASRVRRITPSTDADADTDTGGPRLPGGHFDLVDHVDLVDDGGRYGRGYLHGERAVRPDEWYFSCHFHRDPVMPGSLGVEAILQALRLYTVDRGLADDVPRPRFAPATDIAMSWKYRGQILRDDGRLTFDVHVKEVRRTAGRVVVVADADLSKNGMRIYELTDVAIEVRSED